MTKTTPNKPSVQHEKSKADVVTENGTTRQVPEGEGEKETGQPTTDTNDKRGAHINGEPVTMEEYEKSTQ